MDTQEDQIALDMGSTPSADDTISTDNVAISSTTVIPEELLQLEEVNMDDEMMDPLEWMTRKVISIPKVYFWETDVDPGDLPMRLKLWHRSISFLASTVKMVDRIGNPIASFLGITSSRFSYVTSAMTEEDLENSRRTVEDRRLQRQQENLEDGGQSNTN